MTGGKTLAICGLGGSGREFLDLAKRADDESGRWTDIVFIDKSGHEDEFCGYKVFDIDEAASAYRKDDIEFVISVGDVYLREKIWHDIKDRGYSLANIVAPGVPVPDTTKLSEGVVIRDGCYISVDAELAENVLIQPHACVGHDVTIGEHSVISAQSVVSGGVSIGRRVFVAIGCMIKECISIGDDSIVAIGSSVNRNVEEKSIVQGNPAAKISRNFIKSAFRFN